MTKKEMLKLFDKMDNIEEIIKSIFKKWYYGMNREEQLRIFLSVYGVRGRCITDYDIYLTHDYEDNRFEYLNLLGMELTRKLAEERRLFEGSLKFVKNDDYDDEGRERITDVYLHVRTWDTSAEFRTKILSTNRIFVKLNQIYQNLELLIL